MKRTEVRPTTDIELDAAKMRWTREFEVQTKSVKLSRPCPEGNKGGGGRGIAPLIPKPTSRLK